MLNRTLGKSNIKVSELGLGCWPIGGPFYSGDGQLCGFKTVNDNESIKALLNALDMGINFALPGYLR
ncbi:hypothetical protein [Anaerocolumna sp. MB42-C2]|uniref:hypothetical protein n=1 Tax=Anaerocolumna sp. MB42-C2 TaxID=3070997 RepID=UPI0027E0EBEA|nr:hypothetical protein [Anaerocolumna sp. MB42-C2]WMJ90083.1 hypothetical protein RBU59_11320 [Anaerocolumna sp. MB42-C2]